MDLEGESSQLWYCHKDQGWKNQPHQKMNVVLFAEIIINKGMVIDLKSLARNYCLQQSFHLYEIKPNLLQFFFLTCVISNY